MIREQAAELGGPLLTDSPADVVVPYVRFRECQERRRRITAELALQDQARSAEAGIVLERTDETVLPAPGFTVPAR